MSIIFKHTSDGGFVAGDRDQGRACYAYPSSPNAVLARTMARDVACEMIESANRFAMQCPSADLDAYHARMWDLLTGRAI